MGGRQHGGGDVCKRAPVSKRAAPIGRVLVARLRNHSCAERTQLPPSSWGGRHVQGAAGRTQPSKSSAESWRREKERTRTSRIVMHLHAPPPPPPPPWHSIPRFAVEPSCPLACFPTSEDLITRLVLGATGFQRRARAVRRPLKAAAAPPLPPAARSCTPNTRARASRIRAAADAAEALTRARGTCRARRQMTCSVHGTC